MASSSNTENEDTEIIANLINAKEIGDVFEIIKNVAPGWIVFTSSKFSNDYEFFEKNWFYICSVTKSSPAKIIIANKIETLLERSFAEILTHSGFCVRDIKNFLPCKNCGNILPTKEMYNAIIKSKNRLIPTVWKDTCSICIN
jgi:hypothetical protein